MESCGPFSLKFHSKVNVAFMDGHWRTMMQAMQKAAIQTLNASPMNFNFILDKLAMGIIGYFSDQMSPRCSELL